MLLKSQREIGLGTADNTTELFDNGSVKIADYPYLLQKIADPPASLYYRGNWQKVFGSKAKMVAIVGTRHPSAYGARMARQIGETLARTGVAIVSGLALGIDAIVHEAALRAGGKTIAVLGNGVDLIYPPANARLYQEIIRAESLIISEWPGKTKVLVEKFRSRNRIISGLCEATIVIEGSRHSGTLLTAKYALSQGREVLALPGQIGDKNFEAPAILLREGATPLISPDDILSFLGV